ncbi:YjjW family glycine radical enzyme activase [Ancylomarina euxinus]|uniref:YjjW family glycine radical enzyme activase n=1 Tax=Ancylomarina euxinus TaxID=2283627 RepID=A0A425XYP8_9BACT|nr:YjjW family glycine radical enzyme activase [Ancylomarina euxinus]MCZ4695677.1 YjjW family glycine radical enzyme activase [Ancylomarina euxinus]MUP16019.1 YjjW family glycine radical enzyme activase [Ancylomarina euxinus]RRG20265.1 YjjW family glycine radical enzyme activase [Ancylomarina euxinus]
MRELRANISGIIKSSVIDGPGNRMVIFFQACNLNCMYCHNSHTIGLCNYCEICATACPTQSLAIDKEKKQIFHNDVTCTHCDTCLKVCPENSSPFYKSMSVNDLISEILEIKDFISGITVSGGEVMLQAKFLEQLFISIRNHTELKALSILIDSNGNVDQNRWETVLDWVDGFMIDIKAYSPDIHKQITGFSNEKILKSIHYLNLKGKLKELRLVFVPTYNDSDEEIKKITDLMKRLSPEVKKVLIKMRKHGIREKYNFLNEPSLDEMKAVLNRFETAGLNLLII